MSELSWAATKDRVHERANFTCEYCQTAQRVIGQAMHVEHIDPKDGDHVDNLCLSCSACNLSKAKAITALDPLTKQLVPLFNPRAQIWSEHFQWIDNGKQIAGLTAVGRATITRFKMNIPRIVEARGVWVRAGVHPPQYERSKLHSLKKNASITLEKPHGMVGLDVVFQEDRSRNSPCIDPARFQTD